MSECVYMCVICMLSLILCMSRSSESLLDDILHGNTGVFSVESLREMLKLLPEEDEVKTRLTLEHRIAS